MLSLRQVFVKSAYEELAWIWQKNQVTLMTRILEYWIRGLTKLVPSERLMDFNLD